MDTRRHLAAGAEAVLAFAADEEAVFARRSADGPRDRLQHWLPPGIDWVVCEGGLEGVPADRVVLCLARPGVVAGAGPTLPIAVPLLDARDPGDLAR
jgi:hypothetical protein